MFCQFNHNISPVLNPFILVIFFSILFCSFLKEEFQSQQHYIKYPAPQGRFVYNQREQMATSTNVYITEVFDVRQQQRYTDKRVALKVPTQCVSTDVAELVPSTTAMVPVSDLHGNHGNHNLHGNHSPQTFLWVCSVHRCSMT